MLPDGPEVSLDKTFDNEVYHEIGQDAVMLSVSPSRPVIGRFTALVSPKKHAGLLLRKCWEN